MDTKQLQQQAETLWSTRPVRPERGRTIAGVCGGIAARYRVDPTLVKVAFVVAALFGGSGVVLYVAAWVAFPGEGRARSAPTAPTPGHGKHGRWHTNPQVIVLAVLAIVILTSIGPNRTWGSGGLVGAILMLAGWWLLFLRTPTPPTGTSVDTMSAHPMSAPVTPGSEQFERWTPRALSFPPAPAAGATATSSTTGSVPGPLGGVPLTKTMTTAPPSTSAPAGADADADADADAATVPLAGADPATPQPNPAESDVPAAPVATGPTPPSWDPLGTAPFAWDLPEPVTPAAPPQPRERRSAWTLIVLGLAVIVGAIGAAANRAGVEWFTTGRILSLALVVVGIGLVGAAFRLRSTGRHSTGLVPVALALGAAVVISTSVTAGLGSLLPDGGIGERHWKPVSENDIEGKYSLGVGSLQLDLTQVELTRDRTVELRTGLGEIKIMLPPNMNVRADCQAGIGDFNCPTGLDGGRDGTDGPVLTIDAHTGTGHVEVTR